MAKIYEAWEGDDTIRNPPFAELPMEAVIGLLNVQPRDKRAALGGNPPIYRVNESDPKFDDYRDAAAVYIEVTSDEVKSLSGWECGWYLVVISPREAKRRLVSRGFSIT